MADLPKAYEAKTIDAKWYQFWEARGYFRADAHSTKPAYCIVIPPPNVTGVLHMGHALVNTLQDILIRWKRMQGFETLWVPGTDHAGIATQMVVERHLIRTHNKKRKDFSREEFLVHVWEWKDKSETRIIEQLKRLGSSCDWSRQRFTMDEGNTRAVRTMFKKLFDDGLIYQGDYLVNWDPVTQTALADDEVEYEEKQSFLWHFKYPLADGSGYIHIATTRPETMLGDTAVAVSPQDERYASLIGKTVMLPLVDRPIPIIADHHVDPAFGTGMVKVTPAHDPNDYQMGLTHRLPFINILTPDGKINANGGEFEGLTMAEAREAVVARMKELGLVEKIEPHVHRVGVSYRSKATIEPYLSKQWFIRMDGFAKQLREAVDQAEVKLIPSHWESTYFHWIDNLRDWCISRQLWWGHRIPIWYHKDDPKRLICYDGADIPEEVKQAPDEWIQDPDVLDTWFSSALWPFATLGWPDKTPELDKFYPNSVLVTGHDILFFWVARMIMMGKYAMGKAPFPETFLHGLIYGKSYWRNSPEGGIFYASEQERLEYDLGKPTPKEVFSKWEKMSKSKGNIIDPLEMIDQYGTDAVRMALCASATQARQIDLDRRRFEEFKNFANKIWNGARFVLMNLDGNEELSSHPLDARSFSTGLDESLLSLEDRWILSTLARTVKSVNNSLQHYLFDQAALEAYDFFWKEFCAYYVEIAKPILFGKIGTAPERINKQKLLVIVLCQAIRLMHPMAPFITEELFHILKERFEGLEEGKATDPYTIECIRALKSPACLTAPYPQVIRESDLNPQIDQTFALMEQVVYTIRNIRGEMKLSPGTATDVYIIGQPDDPEWQTVKENIGIISALVRTQRIEVQSKETAMGFACTGVFHSLKIMLPLPEELLKQEKARLSKEKEKLEAALEKLNVQLSNPDFVSRAPAQLIEKQKNQLEQGERELQEINRKLKTFSD
ncbi:valine--tRNA ligase [Candidatus Protochlamydia phocaeensis]|uniref:valine--tRNA ligase n=1 Tax=Candidatus Protochlamydia phocaeensis TaxID=1414722 RepID=UPI000838F16B|nr:valine--tRNA ligase [Candidatus Protochlamydia phocaeensis]